MNQTVLRKKKALATSENPRITVRFGSGDDHKLVMDAAENARLSINAWIIRLVVPAARKELAAARKIAG